MRKGTKRNTKKKENKVIKPMVRPLYTNLADIIPGYKNKIHVGDPVVYNGYDNKDKSYYAIGNVIQIFDEFILCRALSDTYNFTILWKDFALGYAEVI